MLLEDYFIRDNKENCSNLPNFNVEKRQRLLYCKSNKDRKCMVVNRTCHSIFGESLEIKSSVSIKFNVLNSKITLNLKF